MSCDYDVYCRTCKAALGMEECNHQSEEMAALVALAPALATLARAVAAFEMAEKTVPKSTVEVRATAGWRDQRFNLGWFVIHEGHALTVRDEYGKLIDECGAYYACEACKDQKNCKRTAGHAGNHGTKRDDDRDDKGVEP